MALDHGILSLPLKKRGNLDRELNAYNREQERISKAKHKADLAEYRELVKQAKTHVAGLTEARIAELAAKFGKTSKQTIDFLNTQARRQPKLILGLKP